MEKKFALVVGNSTYEVADSLQNPINDAVTMAEILEKQLNFKVQVATDCNITEFHTALREFLGRIDGADAALFYYSGHALQYDGDNYLIPVDARLEVPDDLQLTFQVLPRLKIMRSKAAVSLVFLDACRNNPFVLRPDGSNSKAKDVVVRQAGLKAVPDTELRDALIAFAAEQGKTADDGDTEGLSPFTKALSEQIVTPGLAVSKMMQQVRLAVMRATGGRQTPWTNDALTKDFYFAPLPPKGEQTETVGGGADIHPGMPPDRFAQGEQYAPPSPAPQSPNASLHQPTVELWSLAAAIESTARKAGPLLVCGGAMAVAFMLMLLSNILNLGLIDYHIGNRTKQVGFIAAPNWSIVYTVLFPFYLCLFAILAERCKFLLGALLEQRLVVDAQGHPVTRGALSAAWEVALKKVSVFLWMLLVGIVVQTGSEWITTCLMPYFGSPVGAIDWATYATVDKSRSEVGSIAFSCIAYIYMAIALYVYLATLVYAANFCYFLSTLADPAGNFRLVMRDDTLGKRFSDIGIIIFWSAILGLGAGFMMRLQAIYLVTDYSNVLDLLFSDVRGWIGGASPGSAIDKSRVPSEWTGLVEIVFTVLIVFASCLYLYNTFEKAKQYYLDNIENKQWQKDMRITYSKEEVRRIARQPFLETVFPMYVHFGVIFVGIVASAICIGYGSILLATLLYLAVTLVVMPALSGSPRDRDPKDTGGAGVSP